MECVAINHNLLKELAGHSADHPLLSIYLRTTSQPDELQKNEIRLKNTRREGAMQLENAGMSETKAAAAMKVLSNTDNELWSHQGHGVGIFISGTKALYVRLPNAVDDFVLAADHYHLKPLFAALPFEVPYYALALSQNNVSLFAGDSTQLTRIDLDDKVPTSLADATGHELSEPRMQSHAGGRGSDEAIFHGQGAGKDDVDAEIDRFLREIDSGLRTHCLDGSALLLAGVSSLLNEFRQISDYPSILDEEIGGNVEHMSVSELHTNAWPIIEKQLHKHRAAELEQLLERATDPTVITDLTDIVIAAAEGRVARLFIAADREHWGKLDRQARQVNTHAERSPTENDLLDLAATDAYLAGADVWPVPKENLPIDIDAIGLLRY